MRRYLFFFLKKSYTFEELNFNNSYMNIYVGSLPYKTSESELQELFEEYGEVSAVRIIMDKYTGRSKGFGFVEMPDDEAKKAIEALNGIELQGRTIVVNESVEKPRERGTSRGNHDSHRGGYNSDRRGGYRRNDE